MLQEVARYGKYKTRDAPQEVVEKPVTTVDKPKKVQKVLSDIFDPFEIYDYDTDYTEEVYEDEPDIHEQDS